MPLSLLFKKRNVTIGSLTVDATVQEDHQLPAELTKHSVEEGFDIADHYRALPDQVVINGIISNTPLIFGAAFRIDGDPARDAYDTFREIRNRALIIDVVTTLRTYENVMMTDFSCPRNAANGNVLNFTATFEPIFTTSTFEEAIPEPEDLSKKTSSDGGKKPKALAPDAIDSAANNGATPWYRAFNLGAP